MKTRTKKTYSATVHGHEGTGASAREAKECAVKRIEGLAEGSWCPVSICWQGLVGLAWREQHGWFYRIIDTTEGRFAGQQTLHGNTAGGTHASADDERQYTIDSMKHHMAQWRFDPRAFVAGGQQLPDILEGAAQRERGEFAYWASWQVRMRDALDHGMPEQEARDYAGGLKKATWDNPIQTAAA
jgi:hypothetical protein